MAVIKREQRIMYNVDISQDELYQLYKVFTYALSKPTSLAYEYTESWTKIFKVICDALEIAVPTDKTAE